MKIAVIGSRGFKDSSLLEKKLDEFKNQIIELVTGGAEGADSIAAAWAEANKLPVKVIKPEWNKYGRAAGVIRNKEIIKNCDFCMAFWDGKSKGTASSLKFCKEIKKPFVIVGF